MTLFALISVWDPSKGKQIDSDDTTSLAFYDAIGWWYEIAVAGGWRTFDAPEVNSAGEQAFSIQEAPLAITLKNYDFAIGAVIQAIELGIPDLRKTFHCKLELLFSAQAWFRDIKRDLPDGIVCVDWCEMHFGANKKELENFDVPNEILKEYSDLLQDIEAVKKEKLTAQKFTKKYQNNRLDIGYRGFGSPASWRANLKAKQSPEPISLDDIPF